MKWILLKFPLYKWGHRGTKRLKKFAQCQKACKLTGLYLDSDNLVPKFAHPGIVLEKKYYVLIHFWRKIWIKTNLILSCVKARWVAVKKMKNSIFGKHSIS